MILPAITLYQPWATWIMREWKTIETRTHNRFGSLIGKRILIHAGQKTDPFAMRNPYLTPEQLLHEPDEVVNGFILGSVFVKSFGKLSSIHSEKALIDCEKVERFGLYLTQVEKFKEPLPAKGEMGIWYFYMYKKEKVKIGNMQPEPQPNNAVKADGLPSSPSSTKPHVMPSFSSPRNWTEDYKHENGNYLCKCCQCDEYFYGHKRRPLCKECSDKYDAS
jgi:hypothetical protein